MNDIILTENQTRDYRVDTDYSVIIVTVRYDDQCHNGHNTLAITTEEYEAHPIPGEKRIEHKSGRTMWLQSCGCGHDIVAKHCPDLAPLLKWHLCSSDEPMHYIANTVYHAGDRDHWGLRKGEFRPAHNEQGRLLWTLKRPEQTEVSSNEVPPPVTIEWESVGRLGEGKERDLDAARRCAVWLDATDEELIVSGLKERLLARLPALMAEFREAVESLGFVW